MAKRAKAKRVARATSAPDPLPVAPTNARPNPIVNIPRDATGKALNKIERDAGAIANPRQSVLEAFGRVGGVRWLVKYAKRDPKGFAGLLAKAMPQDVNVTGTMGYAPLVIPVEQRDAIPGEFTVIEPLLIEEPDPFT